MLEVSSQEYYKGLHLQGTTKKTQFGALSTRLCF